MTATQLALLTAAGGFGGSLLTSIITGGFNLRVKRKEYVHDYYKKVIERRIEAYEEFEKLILSLKTAVPDVDKRPYHLLFARSDWQPVYEPVYGVMAKALWLSNEAFEKVKDFTRRLYQGNTAGIDPTEFGKTNYQEFALLREELERILAADMLTLHEVKTFLEQKRKQANAGFSSFPTHPERMGAPK